MDAKELKAYLLNDSSRVMQVLEHYEFKSPFYYKPDEIRCGVAGEEHSNKMSVSVKLNESLTTSIYSLAYSGDIFGAIQRVHSISFVDVLKEIGSLFGLSNKRFVRKADPFADLKIYLNDDKEEVYHENKLYSPNRLDEFVMLPHEMFLNEGITSKVMKMFNVGYDIRSDRIIIPHYDWLHTDKLVGIVGRTIRTKEEIEMLSIPKYFNYIKGYYKTANLFGWNLAKDNVEDMLIIFESEKSVMKQFVMSKTKGFSVSVGGHAISQQQIDFIINNTSPLTEIVIAFDKDVFLKEHEGLDYILSVCEKFKPYRKVSYISDTYNLLGETDSPIDKGIKIWKGLLSIRERVN